MKDTAIKESLIASGDSAFISLTQQIGHLLDVIDTYLLTNPVTPSEIHDGLAIKHEELSMCVTALGTMPRQLADAIRSWKNGSPRVLSRLGLELEVLNEVWLTMSSLTIFFSREGIDLHPYNHLKAEAAFNDLVRVNKLLE